MYGFTELPFHRSHRSTGSKRRQRARCNLARSCRGTKTTRRSGAPTTTSSDHSCPRPSWSKAAPPPPPTTRWNDRSTHCTAHRLQKPITQSRLSPHSPASMMTRRGPRAPAPTRAEGEHTGLITRGIFVPDCASDDLPDRVMTPSLQSPSLPPPLLLSLSLTL